jgi:hypothetical protein
MFYDKNDPESIEKYSSAVSLSDMEIFIFPDLAFALVLANIMSPATWRWKEENWFDKLPKMNEFRKLQRTKQFIMDRFEFNLDLDTWGMTTKERELERFDKFIDKTVLKNSNALFGYEGDKYYFDIDIRRHFGLDKYDSNIIPYWKTETIEAMEAFKHKEDYETGAGECVSFSTLYAAAAFVIGGIDLDRIHLIATPLHSQNFIDIRDGVVTNNRRLVTKNMWFNGTELSAKARRALENEKVTMVVNSKGYVHTMYKDATMDKESFDAVSGKINDFLTTPITYTVMASFLREQTELQKHFQLTTKRNGKTLYISADLVYHYEHGSQSRVGADSHKALLGEIDSDEFYPEPLEKRLILSELETFFKKTKVLHHKKETIEKLKKELEHCCYDVDSVIEQLLNFSSMKPLLPEPSEREFKGETPINLTLDMSREEIITHLKSLRDKNRVVDLAFMALRDMNESPWLPFLKAAFERNPVVVEKTAELSIAQTFEKFDKMVNESIYPESRFAQPDEVLNFGRGEGLERAISFAVAVKCNFAETKIAFSFEEGLVTVKCNDEDFRFVRTKDVVLPTEEDFSSFI